MGIPNWGYSSNKYNYIYNTKCNATIHHLTMINVYYYQFKAIDTYSSDKWRTNRIMPPVIIRFVIGLMSNGWRDPTIKGKIVPTLARHVRRTPTATSQATRTTINKKAVMCIPSPLFLWYLPVRHCQFYRSLYLDTSSQKRLIIAGASGVVITLSHAVRSFYCPQTWIWRRRFCPKLKTDGYDNGRFSRYFILSFSLPMTTPRSSCWVSRVTACMFLVVDFITRVFVLLSLRWLE